MLREWKKIHMLEKEAEETAKVEELKANRLKEAELAKAKAKAAE